MDITPTGVTRGGTEHRRGQQSNWESVVQVLGLLSQPLEINEPQRIDAVDIKYCSFGEFFQGNHSIWAWSWAVEHADVYATATDPVGRLKQQFEQVPFISGLNETTGFMLPVFYPYGSIGNVYFINHRFDINSI